MGAEHGCGIRTDGTVTCWPANSHVDPLVTTPPSGTFRQLGAGYNATCGVRTDGTVACWGRAGCEYSGTCGSETEITPPGGVFVQVAVGFGAAGIRPDGTVVRWGVPDCSFLPPDPTGTFL
jgi:hypothetical protein